MKKIQSLIVGSCLLSVISVSSVLSTNNNHNLKSGNELFHQVNIDDEGPRESWGKTVGDINGDGRLDIVVGGHKKQAISLLDKMLKKLGMEKKSVIGSELVWYENPEWNKHIITEEYLNRTDIKISDIDNDGREDVITLTNKGVVWLKNPDWNPVVISEKIFHDIEVHDLNGDGLKEIIARNQSLFGYGDGDKVFIFFQLPDMRWEPREINVPHGEGLVVNDVNGDKLPDIVVNQIWLQNPGDSIRNEWESFTYASSWKWDDVKVQVADINADGQNDIVLTPSEPVGKNYRISWFESEHFDSKIIWTEKIIDPKVETVHHSLAVMDFDGDDDVDVLTAEMNQGEKGQIILYRNNNNGDSWEKVIIGNGGLHNIVAADVDGDYDIDFLGTNWKNADNSQKYPVKLWINNSNDIEWEKKVIFDDLSINTLFVFTSDIDNDGDQDILAGDFVFKNTGEPEYNFINEKLSDVNNNIVHVHDYDHDGDDDLLISKWQGYKYKPGLLTRLLHKLGLYDEDDVLKGNKFTLAINNGQGVFDLSNNIPDAKGDFLQGVNLVKINGDEYVVLSWHKSGYGIQAYKVPKSSVYNEWEWRMLSDISQDEAISVGDIDDDGKQDLLLGTIWLKNNSLASWSASYLYKASENPDRNLLLDINNDNKLDAIVGYEAISKPGKIAWYEQGALPGQGWKEHEIATIIGPMSLDVGDIDLDGDLDVVAGEHNLKFPESSRVFIFYNDIINLNKWSVNVIGKGDEHHDGTQLFDYDNDGDLDIVSIGFMHGSLNLYTNPLK